MKCRTCDGESTHAPPLSVCDACFVKVQEMHLAIRAAADKKPSGVKLGDFVSRITKAIGLRECASCGKRRHALNKVDLNSPLGEIITGISEAILSEGTDDESAKEKDKT